VMIRIYTVVFPGRVDVFSESMAGVLDHLGSISQESDGHVSSLSVVLEPVFSEYGLPKQTRPLVWYPFPPPWSAARLPIITIPLPTPFVYVALVGEPQVNITHENIIFDEIPSPVLGFFLRYPIFRSALDHGDFLTAAQLLVNSKKLAPFHALLRFLAGPVADYPVLWYFLHDQDRDKTAMVESYLVRRKINEAYEYRVLFEFSNLLGDCRNLTEFHELAVKLIAQRWQEKGCIRTEVTGLTFNTPGLNSYLRIVDDVMAMEIDNRLNGRCSSDGFEQRILDAVALIAPLTVERELLNAYDRRAMAVFGTAYNGKRMRIGYLKRDMAHMIGDLCGFKSTELALLDADAMEIIIRREV
jgi:hypothetical protein